MKYSQADNGVAPLYTERTLNTYIHTHSFFFWRSLCKQHEFLNTNKKGLEHLPLTLVLYVWRSGKKCFVKNKIANSGFIFYKRLKWLYGGYFVIIGRSINQSTKKCFCMGNNDTEEYNMDT